MGYGVRQPALGPRFSATPGDIRIAPKAASRSDPPALGAWEFSLEEIAGLRSDGVLG
jgi:hypothetical protein